jgi:L-threonylcarbamoyladenylate synthase
MIWLDWIELWNSSGKNKPMTAEIVSTEERNWSARAVAVIQAGGVVAFPTDTVYGIGADPFNPDAIARLYKAKGRPAGKAIPILLALTAQLPKVVKDVPIWVKPVLDAYWPGALTVVLQKDESVPDMVSSTKTIGIRIPDHPAALELLLATGPLAVTSANPSGEAEARDAYQVLDRIGTMIELIIDGGLTPGGLPSTVLDCTAQPPSILRAGPIAENEIESVLANA